MEGYFPPKAKALVAEFICKYKMDIADALLAARASAGISQSELAAKTGIDQSDISKIERGIANPSVSTLKRLAAGLNANLQISFV